MIKSLSLSFSVYLSIYLFISLHIFYLPITDPHPVSTSVILSPSPLSPPLALFHGHHFYSLHFSPIFPTLSKVNDTSFLAEMRPRARGYSERIETNGSAPLGYRLARGGIKSDWQASAREPWPRNAVIIPPAKDPRYSCPSGRGRGRGRRGRINTSNINLRPKAVLVAAGSPSLVGSRENSYISRIRGTLLSFGRKERKKNGCRRPPRWISWNLASPENSLYLIIIWQKRRGNLLFSDLPQPRVKSGRHLARTDSPQKVLGRRTEEEGRRGKRRRKRKPVKWFCGKDEG